MKSNAIRLFPLLPLLLGSAWAGPIADFGVRTKTLDEVLTK